MSGELILKKKDNIHHRNTYHEYREDLREESWYSCCYCSRAETEAFGIGFEIDHYLCQKKYPEKINDYDNLFWSCAICNKLKKDMPTEQAQKQGYMVFKPDEHYFEDHFELKDAELLPKDDFIGKYTVLLLDLNSLNLKRLRRIRERLYETKEAILVGIRALKGKRIDQLRKEVRAKYIRTVSSLENRTKSANDQIGEFILKQLNRSDILNVDEEKQKRFVERRSFLKRANALIP